MNAFTPGRPGGRDDAFSPGEPAARLPSATPPRRIESLATLPVFHRIAGRKVVVAGASDGAFWKVELVAAAGADVQVFTGDAARAEAFRSLPGSVVVADRAWLPADLAGAALAIADVNDGEAFAAAARAAGVPVNLIDRPELSDVQFGSIVNRSPLVIAVSTDGGAPVLAQSVRARIEAILPRGLAAWAAAAVAWRPALRARALPFQARRSFWQRFTDLAWRDTARTPTDADRDRLLSGLGSGVERRLGRVALVGAGPGDPELLTLKAVRALQAATVVLYDDLVSPGVLELARREARRIAVGKEGHGPSCRQDDINREMVALARAGETVVRLKGGDPLIFGRATEELDACRAAGIPVEIVPGITAAQGAAAALGFSLTERSHARRLQLITGHARGGELPEDIDWTALADRGTTTAVYMPRATIDLLVKRAIAEGLDPETPATAISAATCPDQQSVSGPAHRLPELVKTLPKKRPLLLIIGEVTASSPSPLAGEGCEGLGLRRQALAEAG